MADTYEECGTPTPTGPCTRMREHLSDSHSWGRHDPGCKRAAPSSSLAERDGPVISTLRRALARMLDVTKPIALHMQSVFAIAQARDEAHAALAAAEFTRSTEEKP